MLIVRSDNNMVNQLIFFRGYPGGHVQPVGQPMPRGTWMHFDCHEGCEGRLPVGGMLLGVSGLLLCHVISCEGHNTNMGQ